MKLVKILVVITAFAVTYIGCHKSSSGKNFPSTPSSSPKQSPNTSSNGTDSTSNKPNTETAEERAAREERERLAEENRKRAEEGLRRSEEVLRGSSGGHFTTPFRWNMRMFGFPSDARMQLYYTPGRLARHWVPVEYLKVVPDKIASFTAEWEDAHGDAYADVIWPPRVSGVMAQRGQYAQVVVWANVALVAWPPNTQWGDQLEWVAQTIREAPYMAASPPPTFPAGSEWDYDDQTIGFADDLDFSLHLSMAGTRWWISDARYEADPDWWDAQIVLHDIIPNLKGPKIWTVLLGYATWDVYAVPRFQLYYVGNSVWAAGSCARLKRQIFYAQPPLTVPIDARDDHYKQLMRHEQAHAHGWGNFHDGHPETCSTCSASGL